MKIKLRTARATFLVSLALIIVFVIGYSFGSNGFQASLSQFPKVNITRQTPPARNLDFNLFWKVWDLLDSSYYDKSKLVPSKMVYGAIQGMVAAVGDPYTMFLTPSDNKITEEDLNGNFEGVGIQIGFKGTQLAVMAPLPGSPAEKAGVKAGDLIIGIKDDAKKIDRGTNGISLPEAVSIIRGVAGTKVTLALQRDGVDKPIIVDLIRTKINVPSVVLSYVGEDKSIAQIKLVKFGAETFSEWQKAVSEVKSKGINKIILDLRNNPGGYLQSSVDLGSEFVNSGSTIVIEERGNGDRHEYKTSRDGEFVNTKVVVLVNGGSASASEILAGALRDDRHIKLIGETTFGKGTIQEPEDLENGAGIHITIAKWLTPTGVWVHQKGLEPDDKIKDNPDSKEDEQLLEAIKSINSQ